MPTTKTTTKKAAKTAPKKPSAKTAKKVTLDDVWATIDRITKETRKTHTEFEEAMKETQKAQSKTEESLNELLEAQKITEKTLNEAIGGLSSKTKKALNEVIVAHNKTEKTLNEAIGGLSNKLGSLVEHIMTPDLPRKFKEFGFTFDRVTTVKWALDGSIYAQIDGLLENGVQAMVVEIKTTLRRKDIDEHLERMEKVRVYADSRGDKREFLGALASTIIDKDTRHYALSKGFFVIEPSGEDVKITKPASEKVW
jgi:hypothetical protein